VLDGGLKGEVKKRSAEKEDGFWDDRFLNDQDTQNIIKEIHKDYLQSGADIIVDSNFSSYPPALMKNLKISQAEAENLIVNTTKLATDARDSEFTG